MPDDAIDAAYRRYFPLVRAKCRRMLGDPEEAQDVAQEAFMRLWEAGLAANDPRTATAWIFRTCTRLAIDRLRRRRFEPSPPCDEAGPDLEGAVHARRELERIARDVPRSELAIVCLSRLDGLTHAEIAEVEGVSDRTVRRLLARFNERLARLGEA